MVPWLPVAIPPFLYSVPDNGKVWSVYGNGMRWNLLMGRTRRYGVKTAVWRLPLPQGYQTVSETSDCFSLYRLEWSVEKTASRRYRPPAATPHRKITEWGSWLTCVTAHYLLLTCFSQGLSKLRYFDIYLCTSVRGNGGGGGGNTQVACADMSHSVCIPVLVGGSSGCHPDMCVFQMTLIESCIHLSA
jgi:hypothetical protein